jgi:drug/metabolite transporter (DMT)-like permease
MHTLLTAPLLASVIHGTAVPILWVIGIILIVAGVVAILRRSLLMGVVLIVVGVVLGGLNVF